MALEQVTGKRPAMVWHRTASCPMWIWWCCRAVSPMAIICAAAPWPASRHHGEIKAHADKGGVVLGICNGFQVLTEAICCPAR